MSELIADQAAGTGADKRAASAKNEGTREKKRSYPGRAAGVR